MKCSKLIQLKKKLTKVEAFVGSKVTSETVRMQKMITSLANWNFLEILMLVVRSYVHESKNMINENYIEDIIELFRRLARVAQNFDEPDRQAILWKAFGIAFDR